MSSSQVSSNGRWSEPNSGITSHDNLSAIAVSTSESSGVLIPALLLHGTVRGEGIWCYTRWVPRSAGMAMIGILLAQSFKSIACFGRALHMKGAPAVLADKGFLSSLAFRSMPGISGCYV